MKIKGKKIKHECTDMISYYEEEIESIKLLILIAFVVLFCIIFFFVFWNFLMNGTYNDLVSNIMDNYTNYLRNSDNLERTIALATNAIDLSYNYTKDYTTNNGILPTVAFTVFGAALINGIFVLYKLKKEYEEKKALEEIRIRRFPYNLEK